MGIQLSYPRIIIHFIRGYRYRHSAPRTPPRSDPSSRTRRMVGDAPPHNARLPAICPIPRYAYRQARAGAGRSHDSRQIPALLPLCYWVAPSRSWKWGRPVWEATSLRLTRTRCRRPSLQLHEPIRRLREDRELGEISAYHRDFVATVEPRTRVAIFIDLVRQVLALRDRKSLAGEKVRLAREQANAIYSMALRFGHEISTRRRPSSARQNPRSQ